MSTCVSHMTGHMTRSLTYSEGHDELIEILWFPGQLEYGPPVAVVRGAWQT